MAGMRKRLVIASGVFVVAVAAVLFFVMSQPRRGSQPVYQGKTLRQWMAVRRMIDPTNPGLPTPELASAIDAVRQMGTNALPFLMDDLRARDALIWKKIPTTVYVKFRFIRRIRSMGGTGAWERHQQAVYFLSAMGPLARSALPEIAKCLAHPDTAEGAVDILNFYASNRQMSPSPDVTTALLKAMINGDRIVRSRAANTLDLLGVNADEAMPALLRALRDPAPEVRGSAAAALHYRVQAPVIVPALVGVLDDPDHYVRRWTVWRLGTFGSNAAPAVPKIVGCLIDVDVEVRTEATNALKLIDLEAANAAGVN